MIVWKARLFSEITFLQSEGMLRGNFNSQSTTLNMILIHADEWLKLKFHYFKQGVLLKLKKEEEKL